MSSFYNGQKVVYKYSEDGEIDFGCIRPENNSIQKVISRHLDEDYYWLEGYCGQVFHESVLFPIDETFAEELLSSLTEEHLAQEKIRKEIENQPLKKELFELTNPVDNPPAKN